MRVLRASVLLVSSALPFCLNGCFLFFTTRHLPVPKTPAIVQTVPAALLAENVNRRWSRLKSLNVTAEIQASSTKSAEGVARDYTSFRSRILMRKPEDLRVLGQVPVLGTRMFDMVSDGKQFMLFIPSRNKAVKGSNQLKTKSDSQVENMRPDFFFDSILVRGLAPGDEYFVTADTSTQEDAAKKHLYSIPEYMLNIVRRNPESNQLKPVRVITFHRDDLRPYQQDLYDAEGNLETQVFYGEYARYGESEYPSKVTIRRPLEEFQVVLTVDNDVENMELTDDQFQIKLPEDIKEQTLE